MNGTVEQSRSLFERPGPVIVGLALGLGTFIAWYLNTLGLVKLLVDQNSHLNVTRQVIDSLTPGITQLGFWPPLLHVVMIPGVASDYLFRTGLAGAVTLIPFLALGAFFLYKLIVRFTANPLMGLMGAVIFLLNPYLLYYAATPMMEVLFISLILGVTYFLSEWLTTPRLLHLMATAFFIALASLARFEGLILIPIVGAIVLTRLFSLRKQYQEIEAVIILFTFVAVLGAATIMFYSWTFGNSPFAFMNSEWSAYSQQRDYERPTEGSLAKSFQYLLHASYYMLGWPQVWLGILSFFVVLLFSKVRFRFLSAALVLASPFIFDIFALYCGNIILYVGELPPYNWFYNERYGLYWIGFTVFTPMVLAGLHHLSAPGRANIFARAWAALADATKLSMGGLLAAIFLIANLFFFSQVVFVEKFEIVKESARRYPTYAQMGVVDALAANYDYGKIFMTRAMHDMVAVHAAIPLSDYISESNFRYYDQTMERPWLFARWVVMFNTDSANQNVVIPNWSRSNERVSLTWGNSNVFEAYYNLVYENSFERVYKIDEGAVERYGRRHSLVLSEVPSLNPEIDRWDPETIYRAMGGEEIEKTANNNELPPKEPAPVLQGEMVRATGTEYTVRNGDTLWVIAEKFYGDGSLWKEIADANNLRPPYRIHAGQTFLIPARASFASSSP